MSLSHRVALASVLASVLAVAVVACVEAPDDVIETGSAPLAVATANVPGTYRERLTVDGLAREALVYVPTSAAGATRAPVAIVLHANGSDALEALATSGWREQAEAQGLIVVFPAALTYCYAEDENADGDFEDSGERVVGTHWSSGGLGGAALPLCTASQRATLTTDEQRLADHPLADDVAYVGAVRTRVASRYLIDEAHVWLSGVTL